MNPQGNNPQRQPLTGMKRDAKKYLAMLSTAPGNKGKFSKLMRGASGEAPLEENEYIPEGYHKGQLHQFDDQQTQLYDQLFKHLSDDSFLSRLAAGDESLFDEMEAPAMRKFNELQGNIASRFSGMGSGARRSSGFKNTINQASSDFAQDLAGKRNELKRQALLDLMGLSRELLNQRPYEKFLMQENYPEGGGGQEVSSIFNFLGNMFGNAVSGGFNNTNPARQKNQPTNQASTGFYGGYQG